MTNRQRDRWVYNTQTCTHTYTQECSRMKSSHLKTPKKTFTEAEPRLKRRCACSEPSRSPCHLSGTLYLQLCDQDLRGTHEHIHTHGTTSFDSVTDRTINPAA